MRRAWRGAGALLILGLLLGPGSPPRAEESKAPFLVRVKTTYQEYEHDNPWEKKEYGTRTGYGCLLPGEGVLTTADIVVNHTLITLKKPGSPLEMPARIRAIDYDVNLAVLTVDHETFFEGLSPVALAHGETTAIGEPVTAYLLESSDDLRRFSGFISRIYVSEYPLGWGHYLAYGVTINFEGRGAGWCEPVMAEGKLVGVTMSYDQKDTFARVIPAPIIRQFLENLEGDDYGGFPVAGFFTWRLEDPVLRRYLKVPEEEEGVYIHTVIPYGSAWNVLKEGDVLLKVDGQPINEEGYYKHPLWGQLSWHDLASRRRRPGEKLPVEVVRKGKRITLELPLKRTSEECFLIPIGSHSYGRQPEYILSGGFLFQELTIPYLATWGKNWKSRANKKFLYLYNYFFRRPQPERRRVVILNRVFPDPVNVGYHYLKNLVLLRVDGKPVSDLRDVGKAIEEAQGPFITFEFEENGLKAVLDAAAIAEADGRIASKYGISKLRNLPESRATRPQ